MFFTASKVNIDRHLIGVDPLVGPLALNQPMNPTISTIRINLTHALMDDNPALNAVNNEACEDKDPCGVRHAQGDACDIGAFEFGLMPPSTPPAYDVATPLIDGNARLCSGNTFIGGSHKVEIGVGEVRANEIVVIGAIHLGDSLNPSNTICSAMYFMLKKNS